MNLKRRTHSVRQHWSWHPPLDFRPTQGTYRSRPEAWRTSLHKPQKATIDPMHPEPMPLPDNSLSITSNPTAWNPEHPPPDFSPAAWRPPSWLSSVYWQDSSASDDATWQSRPPQAPTAAKATAPEFASVSVSASNTYDYPSTLSPEFASSSSLTESTPVPIRSSLTETTLSSRSSLMSTLNPTTSTAADTITPSSSPSPILPTTTSSPSDLAKTVSSPTSALSAATLYIVLGIFLLFGILCVLVTSPGLFERMRRKRNIRRARAAAAAGNSGSGIGAGSAGPELNP
ncbi:hypothetical protein HRR83_001001 [Exophiala dermatitidis]|uniref:Transmembrane protein n=2 Tax=Exophiala dermatitidis TaxID=5970 RepID=H6C7T2_EXODN|nr:uncharacterized protein HMPREF1120_07707 [Exophiala dermatitidis NIH/UT8656]KAJ4525812.1 hypothetical protein HRR74_001005 [Exophiala dermatitidis]EHY59724.1 hypothetical protein HMPREF1120_07707 [Exophiala dermatitidis NIH/UT8656]KAJ4527243.1 hypothetical protein HRR73_002040 [Exophiala dermatitidis]KAJ4532970.1 hypothetical protein HRR76_007941 [Exophiala dermatitidis]KAJ4538759.1 hypothetical protein HRR77_006690 [Exophiala dermatitidis]